MTTDQESIIQERQHYVPLQSDCRQPGRKLLTMTRSLKIHIFNSWRFNRNQKSTFEDFNQQSGIFKRWYLGPGGGCRRRWLWNLQGKHIMTLEPGVNPRWASRCRPFVNRRRRMAMPLSSYHHVTVPLHHHIFDCAVVTSWWTWRQKQIQWSNLWREDGWQLCEI